MALTKKRAVLWVGTILGVAAFLAMLFRFDPETVLLPLLDSQPGLLISTAAVLIVIQLLNALALVILLGEPDRGEIPVWSRARVFFAMQPLTMLAPGRLSDFAALPLLRKHYQPGALASTIVLDRLVTLLSLLLLAPIALRMVWKPTRSGIVDIALILSLIVVGSAPFLISNHRFRDLVNRSVLRFWPDLLRGFGAHMEAVLHASRSRLLANLAVTAVKMMLSASILYLMARNVGVSLGVLTAMWMSVLIQLMTAIPISVQGIGVAEGTLVAMFSANDLPAALALSILIISRSILLVVTLAIYFFTTLPLISKHMEKA